MPNLKGNHKEIFLTYLFLVCQIIQKDSFGISGMKRSGNEIQLTLIYWARGHRRGKHYVVRSQNILLFEGPVNK